MQTLNNILKRICSIQPDSSHNILYILGIKIRLQKYTKKNAQISENIAREVYQAMSISKLHSSVFSQFRHCHSNDNITIIGCGPTVQYYNNEANYKNIALNKAILKDDVDFAYSFVFDGAIKDTCPEYFDVIKRKNKCIKFIGKFLNEDFERNIPEIRNEREHNIYRYYAARRFGLPSIKKFEYEIHSDISTYPLMDFYSIAFAALQFAIYTYPQKIYLVGLDTANNGHLYDSTYGYNVKAMTNGYKMFKKFISIHYPSIEIISVNPVGLKGIFKDVYTQKYVDEHPELLKEKIEILPTVQGD